MSEDKKENNKENTDKISYIKGTYIWKLNKDESYSYKMKIIKSVNNNIKLPISFIENEDRELVLKPRCIVNDPFSNENSLLIWCDIIDTEGKCLNKDTRINFLNVMKLNQETLKKNIPKLSFIQKFIINEINDEVVLENLIEDFVRLCLASNIEIDEYSLNNNVIEYNTTMNDILGACDELLISRFIFYKLSKKYKFKYELDEQLKYMFNDVLLNSESGKDKLEEYINILKDTHKNINKDELFNNESEFNFGSSSNNLIYTPEHSLKLKNLYFVDQRFKSSSDVFDIVASNISLIYKFNQSTDKNVNI